MVKIIATDMDGTLLDSKKRLPKDFGYVLEKLDEKNVRFIVASGRQYYNLLKRFEFFWKIKIQLVNSNGLVIMVRSIQKNNIKI